jgi:hypothetical protein
MTAQRSFNSSKAQPFKFDLALQVSASFMSDPPPSMLHCSHCDISCILGSPPARKAFPWNQNKRPECRKCHNEPVRYCNKCQYTQKYEMCVEIYKEHRDLCGMNDNTDGNETDDNSADDKGSSDGSSHDDDNSVRHAPAPPTPTEKCRNCDAETTAVCGFIYIMTDYREVVHSKGNMRFKIGCSFRPRHRWRTARIVPAIRS